jgi:hypothetical protein
MDPNASNPADDDRMPDDQAMPAAEDGPQDDSFEVELDGRVHTLPGALKGAFLRQADYTRKTQELAEYRRGLEAQRQALAQQAAVAHDALGDRGRLAALDQQLTDFAGIDWAALGQHDPANAEALWGRYQQTQALRDQYAYAVSHHEEGGRLHAAREAAAQMEATGRQLSAEIDGWSPAVAAKLVDYAQAFGVTLDELREIADPRLWKILHRAYQGDQANQGMTAEQAPIVRPAVTVMGAAASGGSVRDELATKEWMKRRNAQMTKGR